MVYTDIQRREITLKLVYCGPALSGKTTNLQQLHAMMHAKAESDLVSLATRDDRTLFFDLLPIRFNVGGGLRIKLKLFTVPGQVIHDATRRLVLQGADGVVFVADSRVSRTRSNNESFATVKNNLSENGIDPKEIALVIQFNKRDLPNIRSDADIDRIAAKGKEPVYRATAIEGAGVAETFLGLASLAWEHLERRYEVASRFGLVHEQFMEQLDEFTSAH